MPWLTSAGPLDLTEPLPLGILNLTPDSFSDGGCHLAPADALRQGERLLREGARALDLGAESTRPGAGVLDAEAEWERLAPGLEALRARLPKAVLSLDTRHAAVALKGLGRGAAVLNDVTGFEDDGLRRLAQHSACGLIAMRSRREGSGFLMPDYGGPGHASAEPALAELRAVRDRLLRDGIAPERILLDPGFGFGTTHREDEALWEALPRMPELLQWPAERICIAISRKRFVAWHTGQPELPPAQRDAATHALHREAEALGYRVFRTHALPPPTIRPAREEDLPAVALVQVASWRAAYQGTLPQAFLETLDPLEAERGLRAAFARHRILVVARAGHILGFAAAGPGLGADAEIHAIYLLPSAWGLGYGRRLLDALLRELQGEGFSSAGLWVLERNARARAFYEALGWVPEGTRRTAWQGGIALPETRYRRELQA